MGSSGNGSFFAAVWRGALNLVFPSHCALCGTPLEPDLPPGLCGRCWERLPRIGQPFCPRCGRPVAGRAPVPLEGACGGCRIREPVFRVCRSAGLYEGALRDCVHLLKYDGRRELAPVLARLMAESALEGLPGPPPEALVPVPLGRGRRRERGYNQAELIARDLGRRMGIPVMGRALARVREGPPQSTLTRAARIENIRGAFLARAEAVRGGRLVLIDDVYTTGATTDACVRALLRAGAASVDVCTAARSV
ncbi:MAG: ComF family protein [bacterium]|nr:ComF family protein [bacterium]